MEVRGNECSVRVTSATRRRAQGDLSSSRRALEGAARRRSGGRAVDAAVNAVVALAAGGVSTMLTSVCEFALQTSADRMRRRSKPRAAAAVVVNIRAKEQLGSGENISAPGARHAIPPRRPSPLWAGVYAARRRRVVPQGGPAGRSPRSRRRFFARDAREWTTDDPMRRPATRPLSSYRLVAL